MTMNKKLLISGGWIALALLARFTFPELRQIGTTWTDYAGFYRLIGLSLFVLLFMLAPLFLALSTWFRMPKAVS